MQLYIEKTPFGLVGMTPADRTAIDDLKAGTYRIEIKKPRNPKYHRKFFSLVNMAWDNFADEHPTLEHFLRQLKIDAGYFTVELMDVPDLGEVRILNVNSISFASMDDIEFGRFYSHIVDVLIDKYCPGSTPKEIEEAALNYLAYAA